MTQDNTTLTIGRADYQERRQRRIDRMRARASKLATESDATFQRARAIGNMIPMGQPILVGHHSEGRHRRDIGRIDSLMGKASQAHQEARKLAARADAAETSRAVSSDDPEALEKLRAKLAGIEKARSMAVSINKAIRKAKGNNDVLRSLFAGLNISPDDATRLMTPDFMGRIGYPSYRLTNWAAESRRIEARIKQLETRATTPAKADEQIGDVTIQERDNRVQLIFPGKPSDAIRSELKSNGFRWSPMAGAWQRLPSEWAWHMARSIATRAGQV